jgi:hypothetical protein
MSGGSLGSGSRRTPLPTSRSPVLPRHLAPDTAPRSPSRIGAARHALRTRTAGRRSAIILALGFACAALLIAVPIMLVIGGATDRDGRTGDDGVFSDETDGGTGGQGGGPGPATGSDATPSSGSPLPGGPAAADGATGAGATGDLTGVGGNGALPRTGGTGTGAAGTGGVGTGTTGSGTGSTGTGTTGTGTTGTGTGTGGTSGGTGGTSGGTGGSGSGTGGTGSSPGSGGGTGGTGGGTGGTGGDPDDGDDGDCVCEVIPPVTVPTLPLDPDLGGALDGATGGLGL